MQFFANYIIIALSTARKWQHENKKGLYSPQGGTLDFNGIINLNETGAFLFELLQEGAEKEELLRKMLEEYDVTPEKAAADIDVFLKKAEEADVLE